MLTLAAALPHGIAHLTHTDGVLPLLYVTCVMFLARALFPIWPPGTDASEIAASRRPRPLSGGCTAALMLWYIGAVAAFGALAGPDPSPRFEPLDTDTELEALLAAGPPSLGVCHDLETWDLTSICDASYIGTVNPLGNATLTTVAEVNEWAETLSQVLLLVFRLLPGVEDDVINTCIDDGLVPALCSILLPNCDAECTPLNPCVATCAAFIESCGVMLPFLPLLREDFARDYVEGAFPEPLVLSQGILDFAMACSDASSGGSYDEEAVLAAGAANAPHCSGPEFESVVPGPCDRTEYERRTTEYQALLALAALPPASEAEWALRRQLLRAGLAVFAWLAAPVLMLLESRRMSDPQRHSAADKRGGDGSAGDPRVYDATSHTGGSRKAWDTSGGAVSGDDGNGAGAAVAVRGFRGDSTSVVVADDRMSVATPTTRVRRVSHTDDLPGDHADAVIMHDDDNDMTFVDAPHSAPSFRHALGMRAALFGSLVLANAVIALSACLAAERAERTGYAVLFGVVALGVWAKLLKDLVTWNDVYEEAVHRYKYGARSFAVLTRSDQANCFRRLRFCKRRIQAAYEVRFSLTGADFGVFSFVSEGSEAVIQLGGLLQTIDTVSNTVVVVTMLLVALSLFGTVILALMDSRPMRVMFDIMLDATFVLWNFAVRDFSSMGVLSALALAVPVVFSSRQLHTVFEFIVFERARGDCVASHMPLGMAASSTTRQRLRGFRTLGDSASESPGQSLGAASFRDLLGLPRSASSKSEGPEPGPRAAGPPPGIIACCALLVAATLAAVPIARIAQVEADCAASAGDLWAGVDSGDKKFLSDGFFSEAHCHWETITALDLRGHDLETIGPEAHLFASAHVIDARDNPRLAHLHHWTATKLEMLEEVLVSPESPVALSLTWRGVNITTEDLPSWLWRDFATLTHLDLSHNAIAELPDELRQLSALVSLNASYNDISALSESMGALLQLRRLDMTSNHLELHTTETSADVRATLTRLTHLYLGDNDYFAYPNGDCPVEGREGCTNAGLPRTIGRSFEELVVAPNCVHILDWNYGAGTGERKITALDPALFDLPLRHIIASANLLSSFPPAIGNIADTLDVVVVSGNVIGYDGVPDEWRQLRRLGLLQFDSNLLGTSGRLRMMLAYCSHLAATPRTSLTRSMSCCAMLRLVVADCCNSAPGGEWWAMKWFASQCLECPQRAHTLEISPQSVLCTCPRAERCRYCWL